MSDQPYIEYDPGEGWNPTPKYRWECPGCGSELERAIPYDPEMGRRKSATVRAEIVEEPYCGDCES